MQPALHIRFPVLALSAFLCATAAPQAGAEGPAPASPGPQPGVENNFGFPLAFDPSKMDTSVDPRQDFARYAAGKWLDVATIPGDSPYINGIALMTKRVERQVDELLADAASRSSAAGKGTPLQQVGDVYAGGMDVERLGQLGAAPLLPEWERIARIDGPKSLASALAHLSLRTNMPVILGASGCPRPSITWRPNSHPSARPTSRSSPTRSRWQASRPARRTCAQPRCSRWKRASRARS